MVRVYVHFIDPSNTVECLLDEDVAPEVCSILLGGLFNNQQETIRNLPNTVGWMDVLEVIDRVKHGCVYTALTIERNAHNHQASQRQG